MSARKEPADWRSRAYRHVRAKILAGELSDGERLSEMAVAREVGCSRTPAREALRQLLVEGVLEHDGAGVTVRRISRSELLNIVDLRTTLECFAIRRAARRITADELKTAHALIEQLRKLDRQLVDSGPDAWVGDLGRQHTTADMLLHTLLLQASRCPQVAKIVSDFRLITTRLVIQRSLSVRNVAKVLREHWRIYQALRARDSKAAARAMREHLRHQRHLLIQTFDEDRRRHHGQEVVTDWTRVLQAMAEGRMPDVSSAGAITPPAAGKPQRRRPRTSTTRSRRR